MAYFPYHAVVKKLIKSGELVNVVFVENFKNGEPTLMLFFKHHAPMPVKKHRFAEYKKILARYGFEVEIPEKFFMILRFF